MLIPAAFSLPVGLVIYGWTAQYHVHWIVPIIGTFFIGVGFAGSMVGSLRDGVKLILVNMLTRR
jgi:hypothetical protein